MKTTLRLLLLLFCISNGTACLIAQSFVFQQKHPPRIIVDGADSEVVSTAIEMFCGDYRAVFGVKPDLEAATGNLLVSTLGSGSTAEQMIGPGDIRTLSEVREGFVIQNIDGILYVLGSDPRGTAYGVLELSRMIGVSPWIWWADAVPQTQEEIRIPAGFRTLQSPSMAYRGIFINDEDWGLTPWSWKNYEPSEVEGQIGPKTHARIFELLLRLRANTFWPAMHECSVPFYMTPGNKEVADRYGIIVGSSHCEPMVRNTNGEWKHYGTGSYDYVNNRENVVAFWEERVKELAASDNIYTLGIRGVHDSKMLGANTIEEQRDAILDIFRDQRALLAKHIDPDVTRVPQVFIPYKEVLDVYNAGLDVPEDVTLMWCDDNYGYIRHFPTPEEQARPGGNGIYYHISYWGRPHDYLWLSTTHPALIYTQLKRAYDHGARQMWIVNVGDIKPGEYQTELFLDMAWNIDAIENNREGLQKHLHDWLAREFGPAVAGAMLPVMQEHYRLAYIRKPEFMANTRTEESDPAWKVPKDLPWTEAEIGERLEQYAAIGMQVFQWSAGIPEEKKSAWFQLVEYPVLGAVLMNEKHLYGQLARHGKIDWTESAQAYDWIERLTSQYNALNGGKWEYMMDHRPRQLAVFDRIPETEASEPMAGPDPALGMVLDGEDYLTYTYSAPLVHGLGHGGKAVTLLPGSTVSYRFSLPEADKVRIEVVLAPNHPVGETLRYRIAIDDREPQEVDFRTHGRSEEWKENVLRNQAVRSTVHTLSGDSEYSLDITALDEGVVIDRIKICTQP